MRGRLFQQVLDCQFQGRALVGLHREARGAAHRSGRRLLQRSVQRRQVARIAGREQLHPAGMVETFHQRVGNGRLLI